MQVQQITMTPAAASAALQGYQRHLRARSRRDPELEAVVAGYEALAKGQALLNLPQSIAGAGWRPDGWPVLAACRADAQRVRCYVREREVEFSVSAPDDVRVRKELSYRRDLFPARPKIAAGAEQWRVETIVPLIPPAVRRLARGGLDKHVVLWEVEEWRPVPPVDPILLRPLAGDLYAVVAAWDLTAVERAVIAGTRSR